MDGLGNCDKMVLKRCYVRTCFYLHWLSFYGGKAGRWSKLWGKGQMNTQKAVSQNNEYFKLHHQGNFWGYCCPIKFVLVEARPVPCEFDAFLWQTDMEPALEVKLNQWPPLKACLGYCPAQCPVVCSGVKALCCAAWTSHLSSQARTKEGVLRLALVWPDANRLAPGCLLVESESLLWVQWTVGSENETTTAGW